MAGEQNTKRITAIDNSTDTERASITEAIAAGVAGGAANAVMQQGIAKIGSILKPKDAPKK